MKFNYGEIPAELVEPAKEWREKMVEAAAEANEELMNKYLEEGDLTEEEITLGLRTRTIAGEIQPMLCGTAFKNKGVQRMLDAVIELMPSPVDIPAGQGHGRGRAARHPQGRRQREVLGAGVQAHDRPVRRPADVRARLLGRAVQGRQRLQPDPRQEGAHRPYRADARQQPPGSRRNPRRRHRRLRGPEGRDHRRNPVRSRLHRDAGAHGVPGARDRAGRRAQDQGRPGKDGHRPEPPGRRKTRRSASRPTKNRARPSSPAWASCTWKSSSTA